MADLPTFQITTFQKVPPGMTGMTRAGSKRLNVVQAFDWLINSLPEAAIDIDDSEETTTLVLHWDKMVPESQIRAD